MELEQKFLVWKLSDLDTFLNEEEKGFLLRIQHKVHVLRALQGKPMNSYVVINQDESYFPEVLKLMEEHERQAG